MTPAATGELSLLQVLALLKATLSSLGTRGTSSSEGVQVNTFLEFVSNQIVQAVSTMEATTVAIAPAAAAAEPDETDATMAWYASAETASAAAKKKAGGREEVCSPTVTVLDSPRSTASPTIGIDGNAHEATGNLVLANYEAKRSRHAADASVFQFALTSATEA